MTDTTNTNELTEQSEKQQATPSLAELDLRDYFAAKALQGICSVTGVDFGGPDGAARVAYKIADAMLAARKESDR